MLAYVSHTGFLPEFLCEGEQIEQETSSKRNNDTLYITRLTKNYVVLAKYAEQPEAAFALRPSELYEIIRRAYERGEIRGYPLPASEKNI